MKKNIILILPLLLLYSCGYNNNLLIKRVVRLEKSVKQNRIDINSNTTRINNMDDKILLIEKRLEAERENNNNLLNAIPPSSMIDKKDKISHNITIQKQKTQTAKSIDNKSKTETCSKKSKIRDDIYIIKQIPVVLSKNAKVKERLDNNTKNTIDTDYKTYYTKSLNYYNLNRYDKAAERFKYFVDTFKNNSLYDNALFWLASSYFKLGNTDKAIKIYKNLITQYPYLSSNQGGKTDAALYNLIKIYKETQNKIDYNLYKDMLIKRFPKSMYSKIIRRKK